MPITRPPIIQKPFAESGDKNTIPVASQVGITDGAASFETGFPPDTMLDIGAGGIAPDGLDMNGILNIITQHIRFMLAGGYPRFDATLCTEIGGYPVGTILQDNGGVNLYRNVLANNTTNFNTTPASIGASWIWLTGQTRSIVAGNGLTGGGVPATADVTLHMGTPGTCSSATSNAATADSHTHTLTLPDPGSVAAGDGLTGGGDLPGNVILNMGTPGTCSAATTNTATVDSHTHALTLPDHGSVTAGAGLTGGGDLPGNLTLNMGTPGTCYIGSVNAISADGHTHALVLPAASTTVVGVMRQATLPEVAGMESTTIAVTPAGLAAVLVNGVNIKKVGKTVFETGISGAVGTAENVTLTFPEAFSSTPVVIPYMINSFTANDDVFARVVAVSATQCTLRAESTPTPSFSGTRYIGYLAIGTIN